jgi:polyferredoxin
MAVEQAPAGSRRTARIVRWAVLGSVLALITVLGYLHQRMGVGKPVGVDALCPFGGLETLGTLLSSGTLVKRIALSSVLLLGAAVATALVFRRAFCGRICPLGYLQELFGGLGKRVFGRRFIMPTALDRPARFMKYLVLVVVLVGTWTSASLIIRPYDPWAAYQHISSAELLTEFGVGFAVLAVSLAASLLYDRFFCKYLCPMGAFLGLISRFSLFKVRRNASTCIDCKACDKACPTNVIVSTADVVHNPECIDCGECVAACPVKDTLSVSAGAHALGPVQAGAFAVGTFALLVGGATAAGQFQWTMPTLADQLQDAAGTGSGAQTFDSSLIKGSTTMTEVAEATGIPASVFTDVYGVPASEQGEQLKVLKATYPCSPGEVRAFVDLYLTDPAAGAAYVPGTHEEDEDH